MRIQKEKKKSQKYSALLIEELEEIPLEDYREYKLQLLIEDFKLQLSEKEIADFRMLKTEHEVNSHFLGLLNKHWQC